MIQFPCLCGQPIKLENSSTQRTSCPSCATTFGIPPESFTSLCLLCPHCNSATPYTLSWNHKVRCLSCQKKFTPPLLEILQEKRTRGEQRRQQNIEQTLKNQHQSQLSELEQNHQNQEYAWQEQLTRITEERDQFQHQFQFAFGEKTQLAENLGLCQQELASTQQELATTQQDLKTTKEKWLATHEELEELKKKQEKTQQDLNGVQEELSQTQLKLKGREEELEEKKAQLASSEKKLNELELNLSEKEDILSNEQQTHQNTLKQLNLKVEELQTLENSYKKLALQKKQTITEKATLESKCSLLSEEFEAFKVLTEEEQEKKSQQIEVLSNKQKELYLNLATTQEKNQLVLKRIREFCHELKAFFQERNSCLSPKLSRFVHSFPVALREITFKESAIKDSFSSYLEAERFLLLDFLQHLEQSLSSEIKYQYQQEITKKKIHLQKLQQENQFTKVKLGRLTAQETELIQELKKTTTTTIESLRQESVQFFQHLKVLFRKVPKARVVKTANIQLQDFCILSNKHHQELLQQIISNKFKYLFARLPWSEPIQIHFSSSSFDLKEFQANMQSKDILTLFMQLSYFFPLLFSSYWPNQKLALFQYQEKLLQKGKEILEPLFVAQVKQAEKALLKFQTQQLSQVEVEYDLQLEKNSRKVQNLETEYLIYQLQIDKLTQQLKELDKIQLGIRLLLQSFSHNEPVKEFGHLEFELSQLSQLVQKNEFVEEE